MSNVRSIDGSTVIQTREVQLDVVETLKELLHRALSGEIQELSFVGSYFDGSICSDFLGTAPNAYATFGAINDLAATYREGMLLDYDVEEDHF